MQNDEYLSLEDRLKMKEEVIKPYYVNLKDAYNNIAIIGLLISLIASLILGYALVKSETFDNSTNAPIIIFILVVLGLLEYARRLNLIQFYNDRVHDKIFPSDANETTPTLKLSYVIFGIFFLIDLFGAYTFTMFKGIDSHNLTAYYKAERLANAEHNKRLKTLQDNFDNRVLLIEVECAKNPYNTRAIDRLTCKNNALNGEVRPTIKTANNSLASNYENLKTSYLNPFNWEIKNIIMFIVFVVVSFLLQYLGVNMLKRTHEEKYSMLKDSDCLILRNQFELKLDSHKEEIEAKLRVKEDFKKAEKALLTYANQTGEYRKLQDMAVSLGITNDWLSKPQLPTNVKSRYVKPKRKREESKPKEEVEPKPKQKEDETIDVEIDMSILKVDGIYEDVVRALWYDVDFNIEAKSQTDKHRKLTPKKKLLSKFNADNDGQLHNVSVLLDATYETLLSLEYIHKTSNRGYFALLPLEKILNEIETIEEMIMSKLLN